MFQAAASRCVVTPSPLLPVTSGATACRPAHKKLGELEARIAVVSSEQTRIAFVSVPFLGFPARLCQKVYEKVSGIPPENILIGATHCHSAPDPYGFPDHEGNYDVDLAYLDATCVKIAEAINAAVGALQPAVLKIATGEAQGKLAYNFYAPELFDPRCHVIQALGSDKSPLFTLVNYAIHPEVLLHQEVCSPDLVGPLYDRIDELQGGVGVFMNSAQGGMITADIRTPDGDREEWSECVRVGRTLADEALRIVGEAVEQPEPRLYVTNHSLLFPVDERIGPMLTLLHPETRFAESPVQELETRQHLVNIGNAQILTIPGEALPNIGFYLKRNMRGEHNLLFGLTNDAFGYILARVDYDSFARYEYITETCMHEEMGEILMQESLRLVQTHPEPEKGGG